MGAKNSVTVYIDGDARGLDRETKKAKGLVGDLGKTLSSGLGLPTALGAAGAIAGLGLALKSCVSDAIAVEKAQADLNAVLASTKGVAGVSADQVNALAVSLGEMAAVDDDAIVSAESMLLTFTKIGSDVFPQAAEAALDLSRKFGSDLNSAAITVGKALNDPIQGVTALRRVGVQLSDEQEAQVKAFMAVNDVAGAQRVILRELQTEVGGAARAYGETMAGAMDRVSIKIGNLKESVGALVMPAVEIGVDLVTRGVDAVQAAIDNIKSQSPITVETQLKEWRAEQGGTGLARAELGETLSDAAMQRMERFPELARQAAQGIHIVGKAWEDLNATEIQERADDEARWRAKLAQIDAENVQAELAAKRYWYEGVVYREVQRMKADQAAAAARATYQAWGDAQKKLESDQARGAFALQNLLDSLGKSWTAQMTALQDARIVWQLTGSDFKAGAADWIQYIDQMTIEFQDMADEGGKAFNFQAAGAGAAADAEREYMRLGQMFFDAQMRKAYATDTLTAALRAEGAALGSAADIERELFAQGGYQALATAYPGAGMGFMESVTDPKKAQETASVLEGIRSESAQTWQAFADAGQQAIDHIKSDLAGLMQPSGNDFIRAQLGGPDAWDEQARRMADIEAQGKASPWFEQMKDQFSPEVIDAGGAQLQAAAQKWQQDFYAGLKPEQADMGALVAQYKTQLQGEVNKQQLLQQAFATAAQDPAIAALQQQLGQGGVGAIQAGMGALAPAAPGAPAGEGATAAASPMGQMSADATALATNLQTVLQPALSAVWTFMSTSYNPAFTTAAAMLRTELPQAGDLAIGKLTKLKEGFAGVHSQVVDVNAALQETVNLLTQLGQTPLGQFQPGSPTPFEQGLRGISGALGDVNRGLRPVLDGAYGLGGPWARGGGDVYVSLEVGAFLGTEADAQRFAEKLTPYLKRARRSQGD